MSNDEGENFIGGSYAGSGFQPAEKNRPVYLMVYRNMALIESRILVLRRL